MEYRSDRRSLARTLLLTVFFNTLIALFITHLGFNEGFLVNFIFSQSIGLCICCSVLVIHRLLKNPPPAVHATVILGAMIMGTTAGSFLGSQIAGIPLSEILRGRATPFFQMLLMGVLFGTAITYFFFSRERISQTEALLKEEQINRLTLEKKTLETHLRLLQAQIEPHFLFNSLANILSLLEADPARGKDMLVDFTRYLRASLARTREERITLGQEMDLIRAYLDICKLRMGERLRYTLDIPDPLRGRAFPPMLIQPLVENAVRHGLEPKVAGGEITLRAEETHGCLRLTLSDTGLGLSGDSDPGVGLTNVRERLEALYGGKGRLFLEDNQPSGLKVTVEVPYEVSEGDHR